MVSLVLLLWGRSLPRTVVFLETPSLRPRLGVSSLPGRSGQAEGSLELWPWAVLCGQYVQGPKQLWVQRTVAAFQLLGRWGWGAPVWSEEGIVGPILKPLSV